MQKQSAFITGGANGIGLATARAFVARGVGVAIADLDEAALAAAAKEFEAAGSDVLPIPLDLSDTDRLEAAFQAAVTRLGRVDFLVSSAAVLGGTLDLLEIGMAEWDRAMAVNLKAPLVLMQAFARHAIARGGGGRIVNLSSSSAFRAQKTRPAYGTSKGALTTLTRIAAAQLGEHGINVNAVAPGITNTPGALAAMGIDSETLRARVSEGPNANFFKRLTEAEDVAAMIVFLCSAESRQVTGQTIHVSAGAVTP